MSITLSATYTTPVIGNQYDVSNTIDIHSSYGIVGNTKVYRQNAGAASRTLLTKDVDYYINEATGKIELVTSLGVGDQLTIERVTTQESFGDTFSTLGSAPAQATINRDLQLLYMIQELEARVAALEAT